MQRMPIQLKFTAASIVAAALLAPNFATAQASAPDPSQSMLPADAAAQKALLERDEKMLQDWPNLKRFHEADVALPAPAPGEKRVVFMGDSITEAWLHQGVPSSETDPGFFPGKPYVNRGISGQTTPQMLLRFRQDVIALKPAAVVIFAGTNDVAGNTGDMTAQATEDNIASMADLANANGIKVVICSILPASEFPWRKGREPGPKIIAINEWLKEYAITKGYVYVDFHTAMADQKSGLPANLSHDGVHPNKAGYDIMNPLVEAGIAKALGKS